MFKLINPFILAYKLQNNKGCEFTVESIRSDADARIRLLLCNVTNNSLCSVALTRVLDWKIVSNEHNRITVSDHLELCFKEAHKWLESFNVNQLESQDTEDVDFPQMPDFINRDELLHLKDKLAAERHPQQMLHQMLEDDYRLLRESCDSNNADHRPLRVFFKKISGDSTHFNRIVHIQAAIRTANRILAVAPDVPDPDTVLESYAIAATEEYCHHIWESLQRTLSDGGHQPDARMSSVVSIKPIGDAETSTIVFEEHSHKEVHIGIPWVSQKKLVTVKVRALNNIHDLYGQIVEREAKSKNSILTNGIIRLKKSLDSLPQVGWLRFDSLDKLNQWLEVNLVTTNPDLNSSLAAISQWLKSGCKNLPEEKHKAARECIATKIKTLQKTIPVKV
jgi:hypothetical protein